MDRRHFMKLSLGAAGMAAFPAVANAKDIYEPPAIRELGSKMAIKGLMPLGGILSIGGAPRIGKSLLAMDLALLLAGAKGRLLERFTVSSPGPVIYASAQMTRGMMNRRIKTIHASRMQTKEPDLPVYPLRYMNETGCSFGMDLSSAGRRAELGTYIRCFGVKYLVIDPIEDHGGVEALRGLDQDFLNGRSAGCLSGLIITYNMSSSYAVYMGTCRVQVMDDGLKHLGSPIFGDWGSSQIAMSREFDRDFNKRVHLDFATRDFESPKPMTAKIDSRTLRFMPV